MKTEFSNCLLTSNERYLICKQRPAGRQTTGNNVDSWSDWHRWKTGIGINRSPDNYRQKIVLAWTLVIITTGNRQN